MAYYIVIHMISSWSHVLFTVERYQQTYVGSGDMRVPYEQLLSVTVVICLGHIVVI